MSSFILGKPPSTQAQTSRRDKMTSRRVWEEAAGQEVGSVDKMQELAPGAWEQMAFPERSG